MSATMKKIVSVLCLVVVALVVILLVSNANHSDATKAAEAAAEKKLSETIAQKDKDLTAAVENAKAEGKAEAEAAAAEALAAAVEAAKAEGKAEAETAALETLNAAVEAAKGEAEAAAAESLSAAAKELEDVKAQAAAAAETAAKELEDVKAQAAAAAEAAAKELEDVKAQAAQALEAVKSDDAVAKLTQQLEDVNAAAETKLADAAKELEDVKAQAAAAAETAAKELEDVKAQAAAAAETAAKELEDVKAAAAAAAETAAKELEDAKAEAAAKLEEVAKELEDLKAKAAETVAEPAEPAVMSYADYDAAELQSEVTVETYVQDKQSWWADKATIYCQSEDGAYFIYELPISQEDYDKLVPGTKIKVKGYKSAWAGEVEIIDASYEVIEGDPFIAEAEDVTALLGTDDLIKSMNKLVAFKGMTVEAYDENGAAFAYKNDVDKTDDLYFKVSKDGVTYSFCVEFYLRGQDTDVYKAVEALKVGDVVDLEGYLYWYEGANPHIISVTVVEPAPAEKAEEAAEEVKEEVKEAAEEVKEDANEAVAAVAEAVNEAEEKAEEVKEEVKEAAEEVKEEVKEAAEEAAAPAEEAADKVMSYAEYDAAALQSEVTVETYVQDKQSWWQDKATIYCQSEDGAYFIYELPISQEDYDKLVPGTKIRVKGYKTEWAGEVEITDATFEIIEGEPFIAQAEDVTALLGTDDLIKNINKLVAFKGMTVEAYDETGAAFAYKNANDKTDDLYFKVSKDGVTYGFCVEFYLRGNDTDVYKAVEALKVGDVIDLEGYLYWYEGANPHIISVKAAE